MILINQIGVNMKKQIEQVNQFRKAFNLPLNRGYDLQNCVLHERLIQEELDEMKMSTNVVDISDAIIDQMYLLFGYAIDLGISDKLEAMFDEVHRSNMSKLDADGKPIYREDGKVLKSDLYFKPNLKEIIQPKTMAQVMDEMREQFNDKVE
jgi:predicted HAD superfamily Cof-like phosphohydrolase